MRPSTLRRADVVRQQQAVDDILGGLEQLRKKNEASTSGMLSSFGIADHYVSCQQGNGYRRCKDRLAHEE